MVAAVRALGRGAEEFLVAFGSAAMARDARVLAGDAAARAREVARLDATPPEGIERVHPSWWRRPPMSTAPAARALLERAATGHLVAMALPAPGAGQLEAGQLATLDQLPAEPLEELLVALGRRRVAEAFSSAPPGALAQLCARLGEPGASELLAESRAVSGMRPSHDEVRAAQRSLFKLAVELPEPSSLFALAGARWLGPSLAARGGDLLRRVAQRLPVEIGRSLLEQARVPSSEGEWSACEHAVTDISRA